MKKTLSLFVLITLFFGNIQAQNWDEIIKNVASDRGAGDGLGAAVAISGDYAIVGANGEDEDVAGLNTLNLAGSVYIFERNGAGTWVEVQKLVASDRASDDYFGNSVAISGDYAIVGASGEDEDAAGLNTLVVAGSAYVFERGIGGTWSEVQKLVASDRTTVDLFGHSVAISGNYIIIGAVWDGEDAAGLNTLTRAGSAYVFERNVGGIWNEVQKLAASDRGISDQFGSSIAISGDYAIVGANGEDEDASGLNTVNAAGSAYVFERNVGGTWNEVKKLVASDRAAIDYFGRSLAMSGNYIIVGAHGQDEDTAGLNTMNSAGSAYVFERNVGGTWNEEQILVASDRSAYDDFGYSVALSGNYIIVGAYAEDEDAAGLNTINNAGSAYIFERCLPTSASFNVTECVSYIVPSGDETYTTVGTYLVMDTIPNSCGKDSVMSITITILPALTGNVTNTICNYDSVVVNGITYNAVNPSGTEVFTNIGANNCDSTVTINLNVLPVLTGSVTNTICNEDSIVVNGTTYNAANPSGVEVFANCDSTVTINLNVLTALTGSVTSTICNNDTVFVNSIAYHATNLSGTEIFTNIGPNNCDSTVAVNLNVLPVLTGSLTNTICNNESIIVNGTTYNSANPSGTEVISNVGIYNCDSTVTIALNVLPALTGNVTDTICNDESVVVNGTTFDATNPTGIETITNIGPNNCDSTVTINLNVLPVIDTSTTTNLLTITANQIGATYQWIDCTNGNTIIPGATNTSYAATANGDYAVILTLGNCTDTSSCVNINTVSVKNVELRMQNVELYPNPTSGLVTVNLVQLERNAAITVYTVVGQQIINKLMTTEQAVIDLSNYDKGIYFIEVKNGSNIITERIVKQ